MMKTYTLNNYKIIVFDLDGTIAESKMSLSDEMGDLLCNLLKHIPVGVISGASFVQFESQFLTNLRCSGLYDSLHLFPVNGSAYYRWTGESWNPVYFEKLNDDEKKEIRSAVHDALIKFPEAYEQEVYGERLEDRGSQMTYSALGQKAPIDIKKSWDIDLKKRLNFAEHLQVLLPEFEVRIAATTSVDITRKGVDKEYGIRKIEKYLDFSKDQILFVGDSLSEAGNDFPVKRYGVETVAVKNVPETMSLIKVLLGQDL